MKKSIITYTICSVIAFILVGCGGINISFNSDDKSPQKETRQYQNTNSKSDVSDKTTETEDKSVDDKSNSKDKTSQIKNKQNQATSDKPNVTVNINSDTAPQKKEIIYIRCPIPTNTAHGSFVFYNNDCSYLAQSQVSNLNNFELGIARNEIYARHCYIFSLEQFRTYFNAQSWYNPVTKNVALNEIDDYNVRLIKAEEDRRGIVLN